MNIVDTQPVAIVFLDSLSGNMLVDGQTWGITPYYCPVCARVNGDDGEGPCTHKAALFEAMHAADEQDAADDAAMYRELAAGLG